MAASKFRVSSSSFTAEADFSGSVFFHSDVTVSGTLNVFELKSTLVSSSIIFKSGSTRFGDDANDTHTFTGTGIFSNTVSGSIHHTAAGISYLVGGDNITVASSSNGQVTINATAAQEVFKTISVAGQDDVVADSATDTLTIAAAGGMTVTTTAGTDTVTFSSADTNTQNTTTLSFVDSSNDIILRNTTGGAGSGTDDIKFVAGSNITLTHTDADNITIASSAGSVSTANVVTALNDDLGGDVTFGTQSDDTIRFVGPTRHNAGLSGSLTQLPGGTSYLIAGTNVTITSASNGAVTIASTSDQNVFSTIAVSGQTNVVADAATDTLTFAESGGMTITTTAGTDTVTFSSANTTYTAGDGLDLGGTEFSLDLKSSGGLKIVSTELAIEPANFAGTGLEDDGSDNLRIASSAAGSGLTGGGASALSVGAGTGMIVNANDIAIDNGVVATISGSTFTGPITFSQNAVTASTILDTSNNTLLSLNSSVVLNEDSGDIDFRVESNNKVGMLILDAGTDQILFNNSPASRFAADEAFGGSAKGGLGTDTGVYISGSRGSIGTATSKGVTTIVGDLVVSGNIFHNNLGNANDIFLEANQIATNKIISNDPTAPFSQGRDTNTYIEFGGDQIEFYAGGVKMLTFDEGSTDHITFNDGGLDVNFRVETNNLAAAIHADGGTDQVVIGGNTATITNYLMGTDTNILLSGTIGSKDTGTKGTVVASGDMVVSGTFHNPGIVHVHAYSSANQNNIAVGSLVQVQFGGETADTHNAFASHAFTAPFDGHYLVNTAVMMHQIDISADGYQLYLSGTNITPGALLLDSFAPAERFPAGDTSAAGSGTAANTLKGSSTIYMPKNAVLSVFVLQQNGAQQTDLPRVGGVTGLDVDGSNLSITKIG